MPSSISSSENTKNSWWLTWLATIVLLMLSVGAYEIYLSKKGFTPSVEVTKDLWSWNRKAVNHKPRVIALVGASRIQLGLNTDTLRSVLSTYEIVPLAINGQYPMATLKGLAEDETFNGLVLMSFMAQMMEPRYIEMQAEYNQYYAQKSSLYLTFDAHLTALIKSKFRFLHPLLGLNKLVSHFSARQSFPAPFYVSVFPDTSAAGDYSLVDVGPLKQHFIDDKKNNYQADPIMDKTTWLTQLEILSDATRAIKSRGGDVVLLRFPTDDAHWLLDEEYYPRDQFWDLMVKTMPDIHFVHFKDDAILNSFALPDSSHLDQVDTNAFTLRLIALLKDRQIIK